MKTRLQATLAILLFGALALSPSDVIAHGKGKKKGHHKHHSHHRHEAPPAYGHQHQVVVLPVARYVYNPEFEIYYDRAQGVYVYAQRGRLVVTAQLPMQFNNRNVRDGFRVMLSHTGDCNSISDFFYLEKTRKREFLTTSYSRYR